METNSLRFGFGKNWEHYIKQHFSEERVQISRQNLLDFLKMDDLKGKYFLDVGCGSGLHSLAALRAGASRIVSFDIDPDSVKTTNKLKEYAGNPSHWQVMQGSALDTAFLETLEQADIVYSWGVLHHTGKMWEAVENVAGLMKTDGLYFLALYTDIPYFGRPLPYWVEIKKQYNCAGWLKKKQMELWYFWEFYLQRRWSSIPGFVQRARDYKKSRGMHIYTDAVDWLGGCPFEFASVEEVKDFGVNKLGMKLINLSTGQANTEYLFRPCR